MKHRVRKARLGRPTDQRKALTRALMTSLVTHGTITTTASRGKVLVAQMDKLVTAVRRQSEPREQIRTLQKVLYTEEAQKRFLSEIIPHLREQSSGHVTASRRTPRGGDNAPRVTLAFSLQTTA